MSINLIKLARTSNIHLVCLPPHTTHLIQPLDVGVFGPIKSAWCTILKRHEIESCAATITKQEFPSLVTQLWDQSFLPHHIKNGFRKAGLYPLKREAIHSCAVTRIDRDLLHIPTVSKEQKKICQITCQVRK